MGYNGDYSIEVLVVTMHQKEGKTLAENMNLQTPSIICNQADFNDFSEFIWQGCKMKMLTFNERGVGLNRNNALMRATADICILADDDMRFENDYAKKVASLFETYPKVDVFILNIEEKNGKRFKIEKNFKVNYFNYMRFGAARIVFRRESISKHGIFFNLNFGGGTKYSAGEDVLFLNSCLKKGLKILAVPYSIACLEDRRESTWFNGYNDKFFYDKGVLYGLLSKKYAKFLALQFCIRRYKMYSKEMSFGDALKLINKGIKDG